MAVENDFDLVLKIKAGLFDCMVLGVNLLACKDDVLRIGVGLVWSTTLPSIPMDK